MDARMIAAGVSLGRVAIGGALLARPELAGSWIGSAAAGSGPQVMARAMGARDAALGLGTLASLRGGASSGTWLLGGILADATDLCATLAAWRDLPPAGRAGTAVVAASALVTGVALFLSDG